MYVQVYTVCMCKSLAGGKDAYCVRMQLALILITQLIRPRLDHGQKSCYCMYRTAMLAKIGAYSYAESTQCHHMHDIYICFVSQWSLPSLMSIFSLATSYNFYQYLPTCVDKPTLHMHVDGTEQLILSLLWSEFQRFHLFVRTFSFLEHIQSTH